MNDNYHIIPRKDQGRHRGDPGHCRANSVHTEAQAQADAIKLRSEAEAAAIRARAEALGTNPNLVTLTQAERWDGKLPVTMVPGGALPMLTVK